MTTDSHDSSSVDPDDVRTRYGEGTVANAFAWWLHDCLAHPVSGTLGLAGRLCGSLRLMAFAHHLHNTSAPSNDVIADYVEAMQRAGRNETADNPTGSMTPDEQRVMMRQLEQATGKPQGELLDLSWQEQVALAESSGVPVGFSQAGGGKPEELDTSVSAPVRAARMRLAKAERDLAEFDAKPLPHQHEAQQYRQAKGKMPAPVWLQKLIDERVRLQGIVEQAKADLITAKNSDKPLTLREVLEFDG